MILVNIAAYKTYNFILAHQEPVLLSSRLKLHFMKWQWEIFDEEQHKYCSTVRGALQKT